MGLFSKLFSRDGEEPNEAGDQDAQAVSRGGEGGVTKSDKTAAGAAPNDARPKAGGADKPEANAQSGSSDKHVKAATGAQKPPLPKRPAGGLEPPLPAADAKTAARKSTEQAKVAKPPSAAGPAAASAARAPLPAVRPPIAPAIAKPEMSKAAASPQPSAASATKPASAASPEPAATAFESFRPSRPAGAMMLPLEEAVDAAMAALLEPGQTKPSGDTGNDNAFDQRAVTETFVDMAKIHVHPLRELMFQLTVGRTPPQWASACRPVLRPLFDAATQIGMLELVGALGAFDAALERAAGESGASIGDVAGEALSGAYDRLRRQMPDAFTPPDQGGSRKLILLESLLLQVPSFHKRTLAKLYAAGLSSMTQLCQARPEELCAVAGIDTDLARAIVEHIRRFEDERSRVNPTLLRSHVQERLRISIARLAQLQDEFELAEEEDSAARKREARRGREAAVLELDLLFAELGDVDLIEELKRCSVRGKIQRVESYLEPLQNSV
jgi:hypothetical protein